MRLAPPQNQLARQLRGSAPLRSPGSLRALTSLCALAAVLGPVAARATPADRAALRKSIDDLLAQPPLSTARISAQVVSLDDGEVVYARGADQQLNPASNTKLVTSAAALLRLGPEFRFATDVLADKPIDHGRVGTLYIKGRGDPSINTERLAGLVADLWHRGLRQVGDLVLDDTYFDHEAWGPGWEQETSDKAYAAPVGALSLNHNSVAIYIAPGDVRSARARIELEPEARGFFTIEDRVTTVGPGARRRLVPHTFIDGERTRVVVSGRIPLHADAVVLYRRVTDPTFYFGFALRELLQERGIRVSGRVFRAAVPASAQLLYSYESPELAEVVRDMNKVSSNFIAEMLIKTLGAELRGVPGTWPKGIDVACDLLAELGVPRGTYQLKNGSGLNDTNRFSARQLTSLLVSVWQRFPVAAEFISSLGIAARDGTMRLRMEGTDAAGRLRAKTGTLEKVTALSGYVQSLGGERFVFSILVNDWLGRPSQVISSIDRFGGMLASIGGVAPSAREAALAAVEAKSAGQPSPAELKARVATYAALSLHADKKNIPFLRTALRTEHDPLVRVVVAEALYRSDPDAGGGALLEAMPASPDFFLRLRAVGAELALPLPVVPSLLDLAAEGSGEALSRILALAPLARGSGSDEVLEHALSEGLVDVGEAAPDETLTALLAAPAPQALAAVQLIAIGLAQAGTDPEQFLLAQALRAGVARGGSEASTVQDWLALLQQHQATSPPATAPAAVTAGTSSAGDAPAPKADPLAAETCSVSASAAPCSTRPQVISVAPDASTTGGPPAPVSAAPQLSVSNAGLVSLPAAVPAAQTSPAGATAPASSSSTSSVARVSPAAPR